MESRLTLYINQGLRGGKEAQKPSASAPLKNPHLAETPPAHEGRQKRVTGDRASPESDSPPLEHSRRTRQAGQESTSSAHASCATRTRNPTSSKKTD